MEKYETEDIMEYITIAVIIALVLPTAHAIWTAYDVSDEELGMDELEDENEDTRPHQH
jgi:hypothetical protein